MKHTVVYYTDCRFLGGAEEYLYNVVSKIDRDLWHPVLLYHPTAANSSLEDRFKDIGVETAAIPEIKNYTDLRNIFKLYWKIRSIGPSVFHANLNWPLSCRFGITAAALAGVKAIVATQHLFGDSRERRKFILVLRILSRIVRRHIAVSQNMAREMKEVISPNIKVDVIYNGIPLEDYVISKSKESYDDPYANIRNKNLPIVLMVARLDKQKGHKYLIEAIPNIKDAIFVFAGEGPERGYLKSRVEELNVSDRVYFLGHREDIPELLEGCDIFVLPSLIEGLPLTIMEAMASSKPVVASDIPGVDEEVVHDETGLLVPKENPEELADAINSLLSNPQYAKSLGRAGLLRAEQYFSSDKMVENITRIYEELISD